MTPTRIALLGAGRWGANILRDLRALGCEVWAVARSAESIGRAQTGGAAIVGAISELPAVAGAVIATPTVAHGQTIDAMREAQDVPVYVEKPLTPDPSEADGLAERHGDRLFVMDKWRYHPAVQELRRIAESQELGPVTGLHSRRVSNGHRHPDVDTVWVHAPHDLAMALEILGELPPAVHAVEEAMDGQRVGLLGVLGQRPQVTFEVSAVAPAHRRELRLVCEHGVAYLDGGWSQDVNIVREIEMDPVPEVRRVEGELPLLAELRAFVDHLRGGPPPLSSAADGAEIVRRIAELGALARGQPAPA